MGRDHNSHQRGPRQDSRTVSNTSFCLGCRTAGSPGLGTPLPSWWSPWGLSCRILLWLVQMQDHC